MSLKESVDEKFEHDDVDEKVEDDDEEFEDDDDDDVDDDDPVDDDDELRAHTCKQTALEGRRNAVLRSSVVSDEDDEDSDGCGCVKDVDDIEIVDGMRIDDKLNSRAGIGFIAGIDDEVESSKSNGFIDADSPFWNQALIRNV